MPTLVHLPQHLQEKIITKVELIGYCRLQQTCKHVLQLAQTSRNITVFMEGDYRMGWRKEDGDFQAYFDGFVSNKRRELEDLDKFPHGIRFETLIIEAHKFGDGFGPFCDLLKKNRITAKEAVVSVVNGLDAGEQCGQLLKILNPTVVMVDSDRTNTCEAVLQLKHLDEITIMCMCPEPYEAVPFVTEILTAAPRLNLYLNPPKLNKNQMYSLLTTVIEGLNSELFPNVQALVLSWAPSPFISTSADDALNIFRDFNPILTRSENDHVALMCNLQNHNRYCKVILKPSLMELDYRHTVPA